MDRDLITLNLLYLLKARDRIQKGDLESARIIFGLGRESLQILARLSLAQILDLAAMPALVYSLRMQPNLLRDLVQVQDQNMPAEEMRQHVLSGVLRSLEGP